jgi:hypothetical protein
MLPYDIYNMKTLQMIILLTVQKTSVAKEIN